MPRGERQGVLPNIPVGRDAGDMVLAASAMSLLTMLCCPIASKDILANPEGSLGFLIALRAAPP